jgi:hypothetical protein
MGRPKKQVLVITKDFKEGRSEFTTGQRFLLEELTVLRSEDGTVLLNAEGKPRRFRGYHYCELMDFENYGAQIQVGHGDWEGIPKDCFRVEFLHPPKTGL